MVFVLAETAERVAAIADLLGLKLLVVDLLISTYKFELFGRNLGNIILVNHFLLPILILGSMIP